MDFNLEKETAMLKSSAEKYLKAKCPPSVVKERDCQLRSIIFLTLLFYNLTF